MFRNCFNDCNHLKHERLTTTTTASNMTSSSWYHHPLQFFSSRKRTVTRECNAMMINDGSLLDYSNDSMPTPSASSIDHDDHHDIIMEHGGPPSSSSSSSVDDVDDVSSDDTIEMIQSLCQQERKHYQKVNWLLHSSQRSLFDENDEETTNREDTMVDNTCRSMMLSWCHDVMEFIANHHSVKNHSSSSSSSSHHEIIEITLSYLDRYMSTIPQDALYDRIIFQRVCMVCFYMAMKIHSPVCLTIQLISSLSNGLHTVPDLQAMEHVVLSKLSWYVNPPTSFSYLHLYIHLWQQEFLYRNCNHNNLDDAWFVDALLMQAKQQIDYALSDVTMMTTPSSIIAYCSFMNALEVLACHDDNHATRDIVPRNQLPAIRARLLTLIHVPMDADIDHDNHDLSHIQQRLLQRCYHSSPHGPKVTATEPNTKKQPQQSEQQPHQTTAQQQQQQQAQQPPQPVSSQQPQQHQSEPFIGSITNGNNSHTMEKQQQHRHSSPCSVLDDPHSNHHLTT